MREVGLQNWEILPLLSRTCALKTIRQLEGKWIGVLRADLNTRLPIREEETREEYHANYYEANREAIREYYAEWYKANKEKVLQRQTAYR